MAYKSIPIAPRNTAATWRFIFRSRFQGGDGGPATRPLYAARPLSLVADYFMPVWVQSSL